MSDSPKDLEPAKSRLVFYTTYTAPGSARICRSLRRMYFAASLWDFSTDCAAQQQNLCSDLFTWPFLWSSALFAALRWLLWMTRKLWCACGFGLFLYLPASSLKLMLPKNNTAHGWRGGRNWMAGDFGCYNFGFCVELFWPEWEFPVRKANLFIFLFQAIL